MESLAVSFELDAYSYDDLWLLVVTQPVKKPYEKSLFI